LQPAREGIDDAALDPWQTFGPGGQARYKDAALQTTLMVRTALVQFK
jgi:hypothetical protein